MNRKSVSVFLLTTLVVTGVASAAGAGGRSMPRYTNKRSVAVSYNYAASSNEQPIEYHLVDPLQIEVEKNERWANLAIDDATARPVGAEVTQDVDGDGTADSTWSICGETDRTLEIAPGKPLVINLVADVCGEPGNATSGKVYVDLFSPGRKPSVPTTRFERTLAPTYIGNVFQGENTIDFGGYNVDTMSTESYMKVEATDATGQAVHIEIHPENARSFDVCGSTDGFIPVDPGTEIGVLLSPLPCADGTPAAMTTGTLEVTLSNTP